MVGLTILVTGIGVPIIIVVAIRYKATYLRLTVFGRWLPKKAGVAAVAENKSGGQI